VSPGDVQPWQHKGDCPAPVVAFDHAQECFMRTRIPAMLRCDAIMMPTDWYDDHVVRIERRAAIAAGLKMYRGTYEVPPVPPVFRDDIVNYEIVAEIKAMDFPNEMPEDEAEGGTPEELRVTNAYERGLSDGEDLFWRKLGEGLVRYGHTDKCAAVRLGQLAVAPPEAVLRSGSLEEFAGRMYRHGSEWLGRKPLSVRSSPAAWDMLRQMILFVTGKEMQP
jgi:hypothetical protein